MKSAFGAQGEARTFRDIIDRLDVNHEQNKDGKRHPVNASIAKPTHRIREERYWGPMPSGDGVAIEYHRWVNLHEEADDGWVTIGRLNTEYTDNEDFKRPMEETETYEATGIIFEHDVPLRMANRVVRVLDWEWRTDS